MAQKPADFDIFLKLMMESGYEVKQGQHLVFKASGQQNSPDYDLWVKDILKMH